jgi:hypothetical protein
MAYLLSHLTGNYKDIDPCKHYLLATADYVASGQADEFGPYFRDNTTVALGNGPAIAFVTSPYVQAMSPVRAPPSRLHEGNEFAESGVRRGFRRRVCPGKGAAWARCIGRHRQPG